MISQKFEHRSQNRSIPQPFAQRRRIKPCRPEQARGARFIFANPCQGGERKRLRIRAGKSGGPLVGGLGLLENCSGLSNCLKEASIAGAGTQ